MQRWLVSLVLMGSLFGAVPEAEARPRIRVSQAAAKPKASSVATLIDRARDMFDDQRYEESIQTLSGALVRSGTSQEERKTVYQLLSFNYITLGKLEEADAAARAIFVLEPEFELAKTQSPRFREFYQKARTDWEEEGKPGMQTDGGVKSARSIILKHASPAQVEAGTVIKVEGTLEDPEVRVERVELYYRAGSKGKFAQKSLAVSMGAFRGEIPPTVVESPLVEYYLLALDKGGLPIAAQGDVDTPLRVAVPADDSLAWYEHPGFWVPVGIAVTAAVVIPSVFAATSGSGGNNATIKVGVRE